MKNLMFGLMAIGFSALFFSCSIEDEVTEISNPVINVVNDTTIVVQQLGYKQITVELEKKSYVGNGGAHFAYRVSEDDSNQQSREVWFVVNSLDLVSDPDNTALILSDNSCSWNNPKVHANQIGSTSGENPNEAYFFFKGTPSNYGCIFGVKVSECPDDNKQCHRDDGVRFRVYTNVYGNSVFLGDKIFDTQLGFPN